MGEEKPVTLPLRFSTHRHVSHTNHMDFGISVKKGVPRKRCEVA